MENLIFVVSWSFPIQNVLADPNELSLAHLSFSLSEERSRAAEPMWWLEEERWLTGDKEDDQLGVDARTTFVMKLVLFMLSFFKKLKGVLKRLDFYRYRFFCQCEE